MTQVTTTIVIADVSRGIQDATETKIRSHLIASDCALICRFLSSWSMPNKDIPYSSCTLFVLFIVFEWHEIGSSTMLDNYLKRIRCSHYLRTSANHSYPSFRYGFTTITFNFMRPSLLMRDGASAILDLVGTLAYQGDDRCFASR